MTKNESIRNFNAVCHFDKHQPISHAWHTKNRTIEDNGPVHRKEAVERISPFYRKYVNSVLASRFYFSVGFSYFFNRS